jgi:GT2 family glycosyltransferase
MYYENNDFCLKLLNNKKKMLVSKNIKFIHEGTNSTNKVFSFKVSLSRNWHYSWSKYYFFKKHYGTLSALRKICPNFLRSIKNILFYKLFFRDDIKFQLALAEFRGIIQSVFCMPSNYRPFEEK